MNIKRTFAVFVSLVLVLLSVVLPQEKAFANSFQLGKTLSRSSGASTETDFTYALLPNGSPTRASVTGYTGDATRVVIPEKLGGYPVQIISSTAFRGNKDITEVKIPKTVITIASNAFNMCDSLENIEVDSSNAKFKSVDGVLYNKESSGKSTKLLCVPASRSGSFTVPEEIITIGSYAFDHCYNITDIYMYNNVKTVESYAFSYCWSLKNIHLSDNLRTLGVQALAHCDSLEEIYLPATLTTIGNDAVLGDIDSDNNKVYYFTKGIHCAPESYSYYYLLKQGLPQSIIALDYRSVTDFETGVKIIDVNSLLPLDKDFDISVKKVDVDKVSSSFPIRYSEAYAYDISLIYNGKEYSPKGEFILQFTGCSENAIPSATKIYKFYGDDLVNVNGAPSTPFIATQEKCNGRFVVLVNNDFSLKGDIDGDGVVSLYDARAALHAATGTLALTPEQLATANADNSSKAKITTNDARLILRCAAGIIKEL